MQKLITDKGFGALEAILIIVIVGIIAGATAYVWNSNNKTKNLLNTTAATSNSTAPKVTKKTVAVQKDGDWFVATQKSVQLSAFGVTIKLPVNLVGKLVYKEDAPNKAYIVSLKSIIDNPTCVNYFNSLKTDQPGVQFTQYAPMASAQGIIGALAKDAETLSHFYDINKVANTNYVNDGNGRKFYKVGDNYYVLMTDPAEFQKLHSSEFAAACKGVDANWQQTLESATSTAQ